MAEVNVNKENEFAIIQRDAAGNMLIDESGFVTCVSEEIDFNCDSINCTINNKSILIPLNDIHESGKENRLCMENRILENSEETFSWSDTSTKLFLCLYKENLHLLNTRKIKNKKLLWKKIAEKMNVQGYNVSNIQTENKFKSLERAYKNMITNNKKTGRSRVICPYETELADLIGGKHSIEPLITSGNKGTILRDDKKTPKFTTGVSQTERIQTESDSSTNQDFPIIRLDSSNQKSVATPTMSNLQNTLPVEEMQRGTKRQMGTKAKVLKICQESMKELIHRIQEEKHDKIEREKEILAEYRQMRKSYEKHLDKVEEQLIIANKLREERNSLLKAFLDDKLKK